MVIKIKILPNNYVRMCILGRNRFRKGNYIAKFLILHTNVSSGFQIILTRKMYETLHQIEF